MQKTVHNLDVDVQHKIETHKNGLTVIRITAKCGETSHEHVHTVGAVDGYRIPPPTVQDLQNQLDAGRDQAASEAAWKEAARVAATQIS